MSREDRAHQLCQEGSCIGDTEQSRSREDRVHQLCQVGSCIGVKNYQCQGRTGPTSCVKKGRVLGFRKPSVN